MPHNCEYTLLKEVQQTELKHLIYQSHYIVEQLQVVAKKTVQMIQIHLSNRINNQLKAFIDLINQRYSLLLINMQIFDYEGFIVELEQIVYLLVRVFLDINPSICIMCLGGALSTLKEQLFHY